MIVNQGPKTRAEFIALTGGRASAAHAELTRQLIQQRDLLREAVALLEATIDPATQPFINNRS